MINGADDEQVPRANAEMLYEGAGQPKKIIWLESKHVNPRNIAIHDEDPPDACVESL